MIDGVRVVISWSAASRLVRPGRHRAVEGIGRRVQVSLDGDPAAVPT